jgi:hypothetical protein
VNVYLPFSSPDEQTEAAFFIAALVRQGVLFNARINHQGQIEIQFTGGF